MAVEPIRFTLPHGITKSTLLSFLMSHAKMRAEPTRSLAVTYLDSFDWRLFQRRSVIEAATKNGRSELCWRSLDDGRCSGLLRDVAPPRFVKDLPAGPFRDRLAPILEMRALLPTVSLRRTEQPFRLFDKEDKTVLHVVLTQDLLPDAVSGRARRLGRRLEVIPVRGYAKPLRRFVRSIEKDLALPRCDDDPFVAALAAVGAEPGSHGTKLQIPLESSLPSASALKRIMRHLLDTMEATEAGMIEDLDSEFLHDFRVAVRRTRSALTEARQVLPQNGAARFRKEFSWLGQVTGLPRDLDVYLLDLEEYRDRLSPEQATALQPLDDFLERKKAAAHKDLVKHLRGARYRRMKRDWRRFLAKSKAGEVFGPKGEQPVALLAQRRIKRAFRGVIAEGRAIGDDSPAEALHDLRKSCKKLRYLIELFQSLYPVQRIKPLVKCLKRLQDNLGAFQDLEVQRDGLLDFSREMMAEGEAPAETYIAMGVLVDKLQRRQAQARTDFHDQFAAFDSDDTRALFKALFTSDRKKSDGSADEDTRLL